MSIPILRSATGFFREGTLAARPATGAEGDYYFVPALTGGGSVLFRWTSGGWKIVSQERAAYFYPGGVGVLPTGDLFDGREVDFILNGAEAKAWVLRYADYHATNKWRFIGGNPLEAHVNPNGGDQVTADVTWKTITSTSLVAPLSGLYEVWFGWSGQEVTGTNVLGDVQLAVFIGGSQATNENECWARASGSYDKWNANSKGRLNFTAGQTVDLRYRVSSASWANFRPYMADLRIQPHRVG